MRCLRTSAALLLILPMGFGAGLATAEEMDIDATIESIDEESRSLTVKVDETGEMHTFRIGENTEIDFERNLQDGAAALRTGFEDLQAGQEVNLKYDDEALEDDWIVVHFVTIS